MCLKIVGWGLRSVALICNARATSAVNEGSLPAVIPIACRSRARREGIVRRARVSITHARDGIMLHPNIPASTIAECIRDTIARVAASGCMHVMSSAGRAARARV